MNTRENATMKSFNDREHCDREGRDDRE